MKWLRRHLVTILLSLSLLWCVSVASQEAEAAGSTSEAQPTVPDSVLTDSVLADSTFIDSLYYDCDSIRYAVPDERMVLAGDARIIYGTASIDADTIRIDMKRDHASSEGRVELKDGSYLMLGDALHYNIETQEALVRQGATRFETGFFYGNEVRKVGKETFDIDEGYFTTCEAANPDYYIWSRRMRLYRNDKIVTKPTVFFVNHFPVFGLPFGTISIKRGRQTGILVPEPGYNSTEGKYLKNIAYFYAWKDYADATFAFDYMELTGWEGRVEGRYLKRYDVLNGNFLARLQKRISGMNSTQYLWQLKADHKNKVGYDSWFDAHIDLVSSRQIWEGSTDVDERLSETITSSLNYQMPLFTRTLYTNVIYNEDLQSDVKTITLPSVSYTLPSRPIHELFEDENAADDTDNEDAWWTDFSYSSSFKGIHTARVTDPDADWDAILWKSTRDSTGNYVDEHHAGMRHALGISYTHKTFGWLTLGQSVSSKFAVHDRDRDDDKLPTGYDWSSRSSASFSLYGTRSFGSGLLSAVRHKITPNLSFTYKPDFRDNDHFYNFGGVGLDSGVRTRSVSLSLENLWQLKLRQNDGTERKLDDFFRLTSSMSYNLEKEGKAFGNISHNGQFSPGSFTIPLAKIRLGDRLSATQDPYNFDIETWRLTTTLNLSGEAPYTEYFPREPNRFQTSRFAALADTVETEDEAMTIERMEEIAETDGWSVDISHVYAHRKGQSKPTEHGLRNTLTLRLTRNWYISYNNYYNFKDDRMVNQDITITRDLHCWKLRFTWSRSGDYWNYSLRLFAVKLPDALQFRTSDHKH